jgi:hypothetical protein
LVRKADGQPWQLYDLSQDLGESMDLAEKSPDVVGSLAARFDTWQRSIEMDPSRSIGKKPAAR